MVTTNDKQAIRPQTVAVGLIELIETVRLLLVKNKTHKKLPQLRRVVVLKVMLGLYEFVEKFLQFYILILNCDQRSPSFFYDEVNSLRPSCKFYAAKAIVILITFCSCSTREAIKVTGVTEMTPPSTQQERNTFIITNASTTTPPFCVPF